MSLCVDENTIYACALLSLSLSRSLVCMCVVFFVCVCACVCVRVCHCSAGLLSQSPVLVSLIHSLYCVCILVCVCLFVCVCVCVCVHECMSEKTVVYLCALMRGFYFPQFSLVFFT
jgi:hypothetical protein